MAYEGFKDLLSGSSERGLSRSARTLNALSSGLWLPDPEDKEIVVPGLVLPRSALVPDHSRSTPMDFIETMASLDAYVQPEDLPEGGCAAVAEDIVSQAEPRQLLVQLSFLDRLSAQPEKAKRLIAGYEDLLRDDLQRPFSRLMHNGVDGSSRPHLISRQGVLAATRKVFEAGAWEASQPETQSLDVAILLVHAVSSDLGELQQNAGGYIGEIPAGLMMDIVRIGLFNEQDNSLSVVDRTLRIWQEMVEGQIRAPLRANPRELLKEALGGVEFEDFFALGIRLWSLALKRDPLSGEQAMTINRRQLGNGLSADVVDEFLGRVAAPPEWYRSKFTSRGSTYNFLAFQERPVMSMGDELLVLDDTYLLEKFTSSGLFWAVHDNERDRHGDKYRKRWNEAHGEFIERLVTPTVTLLAAFCGTLSTSRE